MVDKVEDVVVPSASELGIGTTPSKESGRTSEKNVGSTVEQITTRVKETFSEVMARLQQTIIGTEAEAVFELSAPPGGIFTPNPDASLVKDKKQDARNVLKEWFFAVIPKQLAVNAQLIENIEYLKEHMVLMPAELVIFEESLIALRALQEVQEQLFQKLTKYSQEEFLNKPEEEQLQIILDLYNSEYQESIRKAIFPVFKVVLHLDKIFALHRSELENRTDREKFRLLEKESGFVMSVRIAQGLARLDLLASAWVKELEPSLALESQILRERLQENIEYANELNRINILCYKDNSNIPKDGSSRSDFMQDEKAEAFLSFLEKRDPQKVVYFKLLQRFSKEGLGVLKSKNLKKILPFIAEDVNKLFRPVQGESDFYLVRLNSGESLTEEAKIKAEKNNTPILVRVGAAGAGYVIYGRKNDVWEEISLDLNALTQDEKSALDLLHFNSPMLKDSDVPEVLVNVLKKGHAISETEKAEKKQQDQQQQREDMRLAFNNIQSLIFSILEPQFAVFTQQRENSVPTPSPDLELKDEDAVIPDEPVKVKPKLERSLSEPQLRKAQSEPQRVKEQSESRMGRTKSLKRLSGLFDAVEVKVKSTVEALTDHFFSKPDLSAKVSFFDCTRAALHKAQVYQQVSEELGSAAAARFVGWHFNYNSFDQDGSAIKLVDKIADRFQDGDTAELYHNEALVCTIVPQKLEKDGKDEASAVGVTVHRHDEDDMDLAVDFMMASLDKNKKEICISVDSSNATPESEKLILAYARVILRHGAIPIVVDGEKTLDRKASRKRLEIIEQQYPQEKKSSTPIGETYKAQVEHIRQERKEEKRVRSTDRAYLKAFEISMQQRQEPLTEEQAIKEIKKLIEIVLHGNLSEGGFAQKVILCVQNTFSISPLQGSKEKMHEIEERFLLKWKRCLEDYKSANKSQKIDDKNDKYMVSLGTGFFRLIQIEIENLAKLENRSEALDGSHYSHGLGNEPLKASAKEAADSLTATKIPESEIIISNDAPEKIKVSTLTAGQIPSQRPAFLADIEKGDFTFARKPAVERLTQSAPQNPRASLLSQLKSGNLRDTLRSVSEAERPKRHTDRLQGTLFQTAASLIAARRKAIIDDAREDTDDDEDWDNVVDTVNAAKSIDEDTVFLQNLDAILQQRKLLTETNQPITMQDPATAKELNELAILTRLATMALVDKTMTEEDFLERIITFAFVSPKLASNVSLTPQKTEELKKELRSKFQGKEIDPAHIDELVSKLVKIARHEHSKGHTADEITGQHRDLYASAKTTTVPSHHDDDGEGEARAPAMSHTH